MSRPFRYTFIIVLVALGTCLAALSGWKYARASAPVNGPVILISVDGLRPDRLHAYGAARTRTPSIDRLAADGIVFERAYAHVPQMLPSVASLLTGRLPFQTGVRDDVGFAVKSSERLLQEMLRDRGFATGAVVSSFLLRRQTGIARGFSFFDDSLAVAKPPRPAPPDTPDVERIAEKWLDAEGGGRAFLFLQIGESEPVSTDPHLPAERDAFVPGKYDGRIAAADQTIGRLLRYLRGHQLYDRSTVIVTAPFGEGLGEHGERAHGLLLYEEALRVPMIVKLPAGEGAGRRVAGLVQLVDLTPTILEFAKAPVPGSLHGQSLRPALESDARIDPRIIYSESLFGSYHFGWAPLFSVTDGRYRYIKGVREELYDLKTDPEERTSILDRRPPALTTLRAELKNLAVAAPQPDAPATAADRERFEAAGAVGFRTPGERPVVAGDPVDPASGIGLVEQYRRAVEAAGSGDWTTAVDSFRALAREQPAVADVWMHLGSVAARAERHELAFDAYRRAIEIAPDNTDARLAAGAALLRLRRLDEARAQANAIVADEHADKATLARAHELLARAALAAHDAEEARTEAALAEAAEPTHPVRAYVAGRLLLEQGRYAAAADEFDRALAALDKSRGDAPADFRYYAADALVHVDRDGEAEYLLLEELNEHPTSRTRAALVALYRSSGRAGEAAALLAPDSRTRTESSVTR